MPRWPSRCCRFAVAVPSAVKVYNWTATIHKGDIRLDTPMLYAMGYIGLFVLGGLTGLFLATLAIDEHVHDTYFVVAHFHYIMVGGTVLAFLGGLHFWWPKFTGRMYNEAWGRDLGAADLPRLQRDVLPAIHPGLSRDAAALPRSIRPSSSCSTSCPPRARRSWPPATSSRWSTSSGRCGSAGGRRPIRGTPRAGMDDDVAAADA